MLKGELKALLLERDKNLSEKINGPESKDSITPADFRPLASMIDQDVRRRFAANDKGITELIIKRIEEKDLAKAKLIAENRPKDANKTFLVQEVTLWRWFGYDDKKNPDIIEEKKLSEKTHGSHVKSLHVILLFTEVNADEWDHYLKPEKETNEYLDKLVGAWWVYRLDYKFTPAVVKRSILKITRAGREFSARFVSLNNIFTVGTVRQIGNILTINFPDKRKAIEITTYIGIEALNTPNPHLNAIIRSVGDGLYSKRCVLVNIKGAEEKITESKEITIIPHSTQSTEKDRFDFNSTDPLVVYLSRKSKWLRARPFDSTTLEEVMARNDVFFRKSPFPTLTSILSQKYTAIACYNFQKEHIYSIEYRFSFDPVIQKCTFERSQIDAPHHKEIKITGNVSFINNTIVLTSDEKHEIIFHSILKISDEQLFAMGNLSTASGHFKLREILTPVTPSEAGQAKADDEQHENIDTKVQKLELSYEVLLKNMQSNDYTRLFLFNEDAKSVSWPPSELDRKQFNKLGTLTGKWLLYIVHSPKERSLLQLTLKIDAMGFAESSLYSSSKNQFVNGNGKASIHENTLRITILTDTHKKEMIFYLKGGKESFDHLRGTSMDTDAQGYACSDSVLMQTCEDEAYKSEILKKTDQGYKNLMAHVKKNFNNLDLIEFFFVKYPPIRNH